MHNLLFYLFVFRRLRESGVTVRFVTNTTKESKGTLLKRLTGIGFDIQAEEVFTSLTAARRLIDQRSLRPMLLLQSDAIEDFKGVDVNDPNAVVVGLAPDCFNYEILNKAFRYRFVVENRHCAPSHPILCPPISSYPPPQPRIKPPFIAPLSMLILHGPSVEKLFQSCTLELLESIRVLKKL